MLQELVGAGGLKAAGILVGSGGLFGAVRLYVRHRGRLQLERERSRRARFRALVLARTAPMLQPGTRLVERDPDGHLCVIDCTGASPAAPARLSKGAE
jgi:hypothetical protein